MQEKKREKKDKLKIEIPGINNFLAEVRKSTNQIIEIKNPDEEDQSSRQRICNTDVIKGKAPSPNKVKIQNYIDDKSKKQHSKVKISLNKVESSTNSINIDTINYDNVGQVKDFQKPKSQLHYPTHQNFFQKDSKTEINHSNDSTNQVSTRQSTTKPFTPTYRKHK